MGAGFFWAVVGWLLPWKEKMRTLISLCLLPLFSCTPSETDGFSDGLEGDADTDTDGDSDADTDTDADADYLEVAALGFEYKGGWNEEAQLLENFLYTDSNGDIQAAGPYVLVTLASLEYFSMTSDEPGFENEYCEFIASFYRAPADFKGTEFDWDAGKGGTGLELETWGSFEGYLQVETSSYSDSCYNLNPDVFANGEPTAVIDHMHFGLGFGPLSDHLFEAYKDSEIFPDYELAYLTQYIAMNHPDGAGGYTFDAYDWNGGFLIETDYGECLDVDDGSGGTIEVCGLYQVDADNYFVPGDTTITPRRGYVTGFSAWLEDTPNLDLSILQLGTEGM